jgi:hypothetical protein
MITRDRGSATPQPERVRMSGSRRSGPKRAAGELFQPTGGADAAAVVDKAVSGVYDVIQKQVELGRTSRSRNNLPPAAASPFGEDLRDTKSTAVRLWSDMFVLWLDFLGPFAPPGLRSVVTEFTRGGSDDDPSREAGHDPGHHGASNARQEWIHVRFHVSSPTPVEVTLKLDPGSDPAGLAILDLSAVKRGPGGGAPITGASLERLDGRVGVRIAVPPGQAPGVYLGVIADEMGEERGTLRVVVMP